MQQSESVTYIATAEAFDVEMTARIQRHQKERPAHWLTWEGNPEALPTAISEMEGLLLLDCLTLWLSRMVLKNEALAMGSEAEWKEREREIMNTLSLILDDLTSRSSIVVSNEVGLSIVPDSLLGRRFRDIQGRANQFLARKARRVYLLVAGIPLSIKGNITETSCYDN